MDDLGLASDLHRNRVLRGGTVFDRHARDELICGLGFRQKIARRYSAMPRERCRSTTPVPM
jgi:hypothetical protein